MFILCSNVTNCYEVQHTCPSSMSVVEATLLHNGQNRDRDEVLSLAFGDTNNIEHPI